MIANSLKFVNSSIKHWYLPLISGIVLVAVGIFSITKPQESYVTLAFLFSLSFLLMGVMDVFFSIANRHQLDGWGWDLAGGILSVFVGIVLLRNPEISIVTLPLFVGFTVLFKSAWAVGTALELKKYYAMEWGTLMAIGIIGFFFSFMLLFNPFFAGVSIVAWTAMAFITIGAYSIYLSLTLKKIHDIPKNISNELKSRFNQIKLDIQQEIEKHKLSNKQNN